MTEKPVEITSDELTAALSDPSDEPEDKIESGGDDNAENKTDDGEGSYDEPYDDVEEDEHDNSDDDEDEEEDASEDEGEEDDVYEKASDDKLTAPEHWSKEDKADFDKLDKPGKEILLRAQKNLESGYNRKFEETAEVRKEHGEIASLMEPFQQQLSAAGLSRVDGIKSLVSAHNLLVQNPDHGLRQLIQNYAGNDAQTIIAGIAKDLGVTIQEADGSQSDEYIDPEVKALREKLEVLERSQQQSETYTKQQNEASARNQVSLFADAVDDDGNKLHPHFDKVKARMGALINAEAAVGNTMTLDEAYKSAVFADGELRKQIIEEEKSKVAKKTDAKRKSKVAASKKASRGSRKATGSTKDNLSSSGSVEDDLEAAWAASENRV